MPIDFPVTKYADPSYTDVAPTDDDKVMLRTAAGNDARASIVQPKGYIDGLQMVWVSSSQVQVTSGAAYIQSAKRIVEMPADNTKTLPSTASTWFHAYIFVSGNSSDIEFSTTAPSSRFNGQARSKSGDASRRYIGSLRTDSAGAVYNFSQNGKTISYQSNVSSSPFQVVNGSASTATPVDLSAIVPTTATSAYLLNANNDTAVTVLLGNSSSPPSSSPVSFLSQVARGSTNFNIMPLSSNQQFQYMFLSAPTSNFVSRVVGYEFAR